MACKLASLRLSFERKSLLDIEERLDLMVVGDPLGVYCRAWKWGAVFLVPFKEEHKQILEKVSGEVEQVTLQEAITLQPKVVIGVFGGSKIGITGSIFDQLLAGKTVRLATCTSPYWPPAG